MPALQAASQILKQFGHFQANLAECSVFPAIREMLLNLTLPSEPQQQSPAAPVQQIQSPAMQMAQTGQPGGYMPMMMGPQ